MGAGRLAPRPAIIYPRGAVEGPMRIVHAARTDVGMKRDNNEDNYLVLPEEGLFAVFDGMGGHAAGEVASGIAVQEMREFFQLTGRDREATWPFKEDREKSYDENRLVTAEEHHPARARPAAAGGRGSARARAASRRPLDALQRRPVGNGQRRRDGNDPPALA